MGSEPASSPRVILHVGAPKSGTTFLQKALWSNREALAAEGFALPGHRQRAMFMAAIEVRQGHQFWGYPPEQIDGTWSRLCAEAREHRGTTVMSHELLGGATDEQAKAALAELDGVEVHVVYTARDLARQATSEWQERVKNGSSRPFERFQRRMLQQLERGQLSSGFWRNQDILGVLTRWGGNLPASQVHVVVAPPPGAEPGLLWRRFGGAVGFDADAYDPFTTDAPTNQTLGVAQVAVLRHVNQALAGRIPQPAYARVVKEQFAEQVLAGQPSPKPVCPALLARRLLAVTEETNAAITDLGYRVHGDLAELLPDPDDSAPSPDDVDSAVVLAAHHEAVAALLVQRAHHRAEGQARRAAAQAAAPEPPGQRHRLVSRLRSLVRRSS